MALNLRSAVTSLSPIAHLIGQDLALDALGLALLGMGPPAAFALSGLLGARGIRMFGLERFLIVAFLAMLLGLLTRSLAPNYLTLLLGTVVALAGAGLGNVLLPALVKRYFPDRIGVMTSLYATALAVGAMVPAVLAVPLAELSDWRGSLFVWVVLATAGLIPWLAMLRRAPRNSGQDESGEAHAALPAVRLKVWRSPVAWTLALLFAVTSFPSYAVFAWLPQALVETTGISPVEAGVYLSVFAFVGLPIALIVPVLVVRMRNVGWIVQFGVTSFLLGYLGLFLAPSAATILWVVLLGTGTVLFPACLTLINLRSRTEQGAASLSGFVQGVGYGIGALGPLLVGLLREASGGWLAPLVLLCITALGGIVLGIRVSRPVFVEDDLRAR